MAPSTNSTDKSPERIVLETMGICFLCSFALAGFREIIWQLTFSEFTPKVKQLAVDQFIADCTRDPKSCQYLLKAIKP
jgi:hypothetical protein